MVLFFIFSGMLFQITGPVIASDCCRKVVLYLWIWILEEDVVEYEWIFEFFKKELWNNIEVPPLKFVNIKTATCILWILKNLWRCLKIGLDADLNL